MTAPRARRGSLRGWTTRDGEEDVPSFEERVNANAKRSRSLIWYVNPASWVPVRVQLLFLWVCNMIGRLP